MSIAPDELLQHLASVIAGRSNVGLEAPKATKVVEFFELLTPRAPSTLAGYEYRSRHDIRSTRQLNNVKHVATDLGLAVNAVKNRVNRMSQKYGPNRIFTDAADLYESEQREYRIPSHGSRLSLERLDEIVSHLNDRTSLALVSGDRSIITSHMTRTAKLKRQLLVTSEDKWHDLIRPPFDLTRQLLHAALENTTGMSAATRDQVERIASGEFDCFLVPSEKSQTPITHPPTEAAERLNFEFLPPGTDTRGLAERILGRAPRSRGASVDFQRIGVLDDLREHFRDSRCRLAHGTRSSRSHAARSCSNVDEDYIVLVMQHPGVGGRFNGEDALAISPIANKNATFFARHDSCRTPWRDIFAQTKQEAQELGAQRLVFQEGPGMTAYEAMRYKVIALAECSSFSFHRGVRYDHNRDKYVPR